jgi:hypothetical protein
MRFETQPRVARIDTGRQQNAALLVRYLAFLTGTSYVPPAPNSNVIAYSAETFEYLDFKPRVYPEWVFPVLSAQALLFPSTTTVPNVVGLDLSVALTVLQNATLVGAAIFQSTALGIAYNQVFLQSLPPGTQVGQGAVVNVTVQNLTVVPLVVGLLQAAAQTALNVAHLVAAIVLQVSALPTGQVIAQDQTAGTGVLANAVVTLTVATQGNGFRVQAVTAGWYQGTYYNVGDIFDLLQASDFSDSTLNYESGGGEYGAGWMLQVSASASLTLDDGNAFFPAVDPNRRYVE